LKEKINELELNNKNRNIRDLYGGINEFKRGYHPISDLVEDVYGDLLPDSHIKKTYDSVRREVLYNILIVFWVPMKLVRLIKMCLNETYSKVRTSKNLSENFTIQNGLRRGDSLPPLLFNFALECAIRKIKGNYVGIILNPTHQFLACADHVNLLGGKIGTKSKSTETLIDASKEVGLEMEAEKTKYKLLFRHQNAG
jgi:hypothetical protein